MSDLGWGAGGVSEALQLYQSLQTGQIENQQKQVALQTSELQLENLKKLQASLGSQTFGSLASGSGSSGQSKALMQLADTYLASNMPQQAKAVVDMATNMATTKAYVTEQQANSAKKFIDMASDLFSGVNNAQEWAVAQQFMQSQLPPEAMQNPVVKGLLTSGYSPDKVRMLPQFFDRMKARAQAAADTARANMEDAHSRYYSFEEKKDLAEADAAEARADWYRRNGAGNLVPSKEEISAVANDLQAQFPEAEAQPVVQGGKITDSTATRSNYKARVEARAIDIAETAKSYTRAGMNPTEARKRAIQEADLRGDLSTLKAPPGPASSSTSSTRDVPAAVEGWGDPTQVNP